jgi:hypothetical protein
MQKKMIYVFEPYYEEVRITPNIPEARIIALLGADYNKPEFPAGTKFVLYKDRIPVALIPTPDGGGVCLAFDTFVPRAFPARSYIEADTISKAEFLQYRELSCI